MESSTRLAQCYDLLNNLRDSLGSQSAHLSFLQSFSWVLQKNRSEVQHVSRLLVEQVDGVTQRRREGALIDRTIASSPAVQH